MALIIKKSERNERTHRPGELSGIVSLFRVALGGLKNPRISFGDMVLTPARPESHNPGCVYLKSAQGEYWGKITPEGNYCPGATAPGWLFARVEHLAQNPAAAAAAYGREVGACCFCSRILTDERSTVVGYGPVCARNYGLPWGAEGEPLEVATVENRHGRRLQHLQAVSHR